MRGGKRERGVGGKRIANDRGKRWRREGRGMWGKGGFREKREGDSEEEGLRG